MSTPPNVCYRPLPTINVEVDGKQITVHHYRIQGFGTGMPPEGVDLDWPDSAFHRSISKDNTVKEAIQRIGWSCFDELYLIEQDCLPADHEKRMILLPFDTEHYSVNEHLLRIKDGGKSFRLLTHGSPAMATENQKSIQDVLQEKAQKREEREEPGVEKTLPEEGTPLGKSLQATGSAVIGGASLAGADGLNRAVTALARKVAVKLGFTEETVGHAAFNNVVGILAPFVLHFITENFPEIPGANILKPASEKAMEATSFRLVSQVMDQILPELGELQAQAQTLASLGALAPPREDDVVKETARVKERAFA